MYPLSLPKVGQGESRGRVRTAGLGKGPGTHQCLAVQGGNRASVLSPRAPQNIMCIHLGSLMNILFKCSFLLS